MKQRKVKAFVMVCINFFVSLGGVVTGVFRAAPVEYYVTIGAMFGAFCFFAALFVWGLVFTDKIFQDGASEKLIDIIVEKVKGLVK